MTHMGAIEKIQVGIIGLGRSGRNIHAHILAALPDYYRIAAVSDPMEERLVRARQDFGCETYRDYREMLQQTDLDLIINATPSHLHVPVSIEIVNSGKHGVCEKPVARKTADVDELIRAAERTGKVLTVFQQSRFSPAFMKMREVIDSGVLGRIVQVSIALNGFQRRWDWQSQKQFNGGSLLNTGPHPLDQALQLFGTDTMPEVTCSMDRANSFGDAEDHVNLMLKGEGRPLIHLTISSCCAYPGEMYNVFGTQGGLSGSMNELKWKYFDPAEAPQQQLITKPLANAEGAPIYGSEELKWYEHHWTAEKQEGIDLFAGMGHTYYRRLYETLREGKPLQVTLQQVRQQVAVMERCFEQNPLFGVE